MLLIQKFDEFVITYFSTVFLILLVTSISFAQGGMWTTRTNMPTARQYFACVETNGKIYTFGGSINPMNSTDAVEVYDPETDTWTTKNKMPEEMLGLAAVALNGKIYIIGGRIGDSYSGTTLNYTYLYDPDSDSWTRKADMPISLAYPTSSVVDGKIYVIGGATSGYRGLTTVQMYDPSTDSWTSKADLPRAKVLHTANVHDGKIYVIGGGYAAGNSGGVVFADFDVYDPVSDSWSPNDDIVQARLGHGSAVLNDELYILGGFTTNTVLQDLEEYNFNTNKWNTKPPLPSTLRGFACCVYDNKLFVFGGVSGGSGASAIHKVYVYSPKVIDINDAFNEQGNNVKFDLLQNYPNPFNPSTILSFVIGHSSFVSLKVYDILGREVATLVNEEKSAGSYEVEFKPESSVLNLASGIYFYRLHAGDFTETKKMILLK